LNFYKNVKFIIYYICLKFFNLSFVSVKTEDGTQIKEHESVISVRKSEDDLSGELNIDNIEHAISG